MTKKILMSFYFYQMSNVFWLAEKAHSTFIRAPTIDICLMESSQSRSHFYVVNGFQESLAVQMD